MPGMPRAKTKAQAPVKSERPQTKNSGARLPVTLIERIDEEARRLMRATPGTRADRTSVMIAILDAHLPPLPGGGA